MAFICYFTENLTCLNFHLLSLNICLLKEYLLLTLSSFLVIHFISYLKNNISSTKNAFIFLKKYLLLI